MTFSVILPTFNEKESISSMLHALEALNLDGLIEIIVADDHSPDGTEGIALDVAKTLKLPVSVVQNPGKPGLAPSVVCGFAKATGDIFVCMDADGQHRPEDLPDLLAEFDNDSDLEMVIGSRHVSGGGFTEKWSFFRRLCSDTASTMARLALGITLKDPMSGFFAIRRTTFQRVQRFLSPKGFKIMLELAFLLSLYGKKNILEHPIIFSMRKHGQSKLSQKVILQYMFMLIRFIFTKRKLRRLIMQQ